MSFSLDNRFITVAVSPEPPVEFFFNRMVATEELGRPFRYEVDLVSIRSTYALKDLLGSSMTVSVQLEAAGQKRHFNGVVTRAVLLGLEAGYLRYRVELRPWLWLLSRQQTCRIFQGDSVPAILDKVFREAGFSGDVERSLSGSYPDLEYCVQYRETTLDFVSRLMEQAGIYYFFKHTAAGHKLLLVDDPNGHSPADDAAEIEYFDSEEDYRRTSDHIFDWQATASLQSGAFAHTDYNFETPRADLAARAVASGGHPHGDYEVFDYPGEYGATGPGTDLATVRLQAIDVRREVLLAAGNVRPLGVGHTFKLTNYTDDNSQNREYLVISATYTLSMAEAFGDAGGRGDTYGMTFECIPAKVNFRPARITPRPMIAGPQTARVVTASGETITTDQYGRVKVKFFWDRAEAQDDTASCWIRVSQPWAGQGWGGLSLPRKDQEVIVEFLEGDPDRPIITGRVYNAAMTVPYALPGEKSKTTLKSESFTDGSGGSGFNEFRFEDKAGSEEIYLHAEKDMLVEIRNNETRKIEQGNRETTLAQGNDTLTLDQGNRTSTISQGNDKTDVSAGKSETTAAQSITLTVGSATVKLEPSAITASVGGNSVKIDTSGVTVNGTKVDITGSAQVGVTGGIIKLN